MLLFELTNIQKSIEFRIPAYRHYIINPRQPTTSALPIPSVWLNIESELMNITTVIVLRESITIQPYLLISLRRCILISQWRGAHTENNHHDSICQSNGGINTMLAYTNGITEFPYRSKLIYDDYIVNNHLDVDRNETVGRWRTVGKISSISSFSNTRWRTLLSIIRSANLASRGVLCTYV